MRRRLILAVMVVTVVTAAIAACTPDEVAAYCKATKKCNTGSSSSTSSPTSSTTSSTSPPPNGFVQRCQTTQLCVGTTPFHLMGGTNYGTMGNNGAEVSLAQDLKRDIIEPVNFQTQYRQLSDATSEATWRQIDDLLAQAHTGNVRLILNLSEFAKDLAIANINPLTALARWDQYIDFIANRTNTLSGVQYKNDPTIAMMEVWGEPCYVGEDWGAGTDCPGTVTKAADYTVANMATFFSHVMARWHADAPNILTSSGGFSHINDAGDRLAWQQTMADPNNATCDVEVNSPDDYNISVPQVTNYCRTLNKGWFLAAWSSCYQDPGYSWPVMNTDQDMANHAQNMFDTAHAVNGTPSTYPAVGTDFWNMAHNPGPGHCDIDGSYPITAQTVRNNP